MKSIKRNWLFVFVLFFVLMLGQRKVVFGIDKLPNFQEVASAYDQRQYVPGEVIVKFKKDKINLSAGFSLTSELRKLIFNWTKGYQTDETIKSGNLVVLKLKEGQNLNEVLVSLRADPNVEHVQPNYYRQISALSIDDTYKTDLWGLENTGQTITYDSGATSVGTSGVDMDIRRAWAVSTGTTEVIVAVLDTGVAIDHPDLSSILWDGTNCKDENGTALGGCLGGYDYIDNDVDPSPSNFFKDDHGTHVAGTIAAARNNTQGIAGVGPNIKIMALKVGVSGMIETVSELKAIDFAIQNGAKVINASFGGPSYDPLELAAIQDFRDAGGIFVASAGNDAKDNDSEGHSYPSDYNLNNIISVAAIDNDDTLASFSNYGLTSVDVGAPGVAILSSVSFRKNYIQDFISPTGLTPDGGSYWGLWGLVSGAGILIGDTNALSGNYIDNSDNYVTSGQIDLSSLSANLVRINFDAVCNDLGTTLGGDASGDYMALEVSGDGSTFTEIYRWNEAKLPTLIDGGCGSGGCGAPVYVDVGSTFLTSNFTYRFHWVTDSSLNTSTGCYISDMKIIDYPTRGANAGYDFKPGTSMAAPHVAGLAGYLWSIKPEATMGEIVSSILTTGDTIPALVGKTTTGSRVNAYNAVLSLGITALTGPSVTGLSDDLVPAKSKTLTWGSTAPATDGYRFSIDQSVSGVPTGSYSVGLTGTTYSSGDGTFYIHVQAQDADLAEGPVATASFVLDNTGPEASVSSSAANLFTLSFGETLYSDVGATFAIGTDVASRFAVSSEIGISEALVAGSESISIGITGTPLAGTNVNLLSGTATNNFYDYLTNAGGTLAVFFDGDAWQANPSSLNVATTHFPDLITTGQLTLGGSAPETATSLTATNNLTLNIGGTGANSSVGLTLGTVITELNDAVFNANLISGTQVDVTTISGLDVGYTAVGAIQWGISGTTLKFSPPITVSIYLGSSYNSQTLYVYRSESLSVGWTSSGLSSPTCVVSGGYCSFAATQASYFLAASSPTPTPTPSPTSAPTSAPSNDSGNNNNQSSGAPKAPRCNDRVPVFAPDLFRITTSKGNAKIIFTPVNEQITGYAVMYGHKKGDERYAAIFSPINNNEGEQSFIVGKLNPKITYYFKVTAFNGCVSGPWSDWIPAKPDRKREIHKYKTVIKNKVKTLVNRFL